MDSRLKIIGLYGASFGGMSLFIQGLKQTTEARVLWLDSGPLAPYLDLCDAIIFLHDEGRDQIPLVRTAGKPLLSRSIPQLELGVPVIHMDDEEPARLMAERMVQHGAVALHYWGINKPFSHRRSKGTRAAAQTHGLPFRETTTLEQTLTALLDAPKPAGLVCMNDEHAYLMAKALYDCGRLVPSKVMLAGYDNTAIPDSPWAIALTSTELPMREQGELAGRLLLGGIAGSVVDVKIHTTSAARIIYRESTKDTSIGSGLVKSHVSSV